MYYFDTASTSYNLNSVVVETLKEMISEGIGNPSSLHKIGERAKSQLEEARAMVAKAINAEPNQIFFFSSATEANNFVRDVHYGFMYSTDGIEHASISSIKPDCVDDAKQEYGVYTHCMVSNITGEIFDIKKMSRDTACFHTDATSAVGNVSIDVVDLDVDFLTLPSSHKVGSIAGACALYVRSPEYIPNDSKRLIGGLQESGVRAGTENLPAIYCYARALQAICSRNKDVFEIIHGLNIVIRDEIETVLKKNNVEYILPRFSDESDFGYTNIMLIAFKNVNAETLQFLLSNEGIMVSTLSACSSEKPDNRILDALKLDENYRNGTIRLSWHEFSSHKVNHVAEKISYYVNKLISIQ